MCLTKEQAPWPFAQVNPSQWGDAAGLLAPKELVRGLLHQEPYQAQMDMASGQVFQDPQITSAWAERTTLFKWRGTRTLKLSESREWGPLPLQGANL